MNTTDISNELRLNPNKTLISKSQIILGTYLGGPLAGCYLLRHNFKMLENDEAARKCLLWGFVASLLFLLTVMTLVPDALWEKIPHFIVPLSYTILITELANAFQLKRVKQYYELGIKKYSWLKVILVSILSLLAFMAIAFIIGLTLVFLEP